MGFELYPYDHACTPNRPQRGLGITLDKHGRLLLNADTFAALGLPGHVRLLYDRSAGVIGIQASRDDDWHALRVCSPPSDPHSHRVSAKGFCAYFGLRPYLGRRYPGEMRDGMLHVALGEQREIDTTANGPMQAMTIQPGAQSLADARPVPRPPRRDTAARRTATGGPPSPEASHARQDEPTITEETESDCDRTVARKIGQFAGSRRAYHRRVAPLSACVDG